MSKCPMCNIEMKEHISSSGKNYICTSDDLHFYMEYKDNNNNISFRKISYNLDTEISINYENHSSIIVYKRLNSPRMKFTFPYELPIDFPNLDSTKENINTLVLFS